MFLSLHVEHTLVVPLARLGLRQVAGSQCDGLGHAHGDIDLGRGQDLGTILGERGMERFRLFRYSCCVTFEYFYLIWGQSWRREGELE